MEHLNFLSTTDNSNSFSHYVSKLYIILLQLTEVSEGGGLPGGAGVAILQPGHAQQLLGHGGGHDAGSPGGGDQPDVDGTALSVHLAGHCVGLAELVAPVTAPDGDEGELGEDDGAADGGGHLLAALHSETDVAVVVTDGDESL